MNLGSDSDAGPGHRRDTAVRSAAHRFLLQGRPDLVLLMVVTFSVTQGVSEGLLAGLLGGLLVDFFSAAPFGAATVGMGLVGLLTGLGDANIYRANLLIPLIAVFVATVVYHSFLMLAFRPTAEPWSGCPPWRFKPCPGRS